MVIQCEGLIDSNILVSAISPLNVKDDRDFGLRLQRNMLSATARTNYANAPIGSHNGKTKGFVLRTSRTSLLTNEGSTTTW